MRSISIVVTCDACHDEVLEEVDGSSIVQFTARGVQSEMDLCDDCLYGTFLQEGRPSGNRKKRGVGEFDCPGCGKAFKTQRGLSHHQTRMHGQG